MPISITISVTIFCTVEHPFKKVKLYKLRSQGLRYACTHGKYANGQPNGKYVNFIQHIAFVQVYTINLPDAVKLGGAYE